MNSIADRRPTGSSDLGRAVPRRTADADLDRDALFEALADERRRAVLAVLYDRGGVSSFGDLAAVVLDRTADRPPGAVSPARHERVSVVLAHVDLPRLAAADLVAYDLARDTVRMTDVGDALRPIVAPLLA